MTTNKIINISFFSTLIAVIGIVTYTQGKIIRAEVKKEWGV